MESIICFVNSNNQYGLEALHEEAEDVDISQEGESLHSPIDIENARQVVAGQEVCNSVLALKRRIILVILKLFLITNTQSIIIIHNNKGIR